MFTQDILNVFQSDVYTDLIKGSKCFLNLKRLHLELVQRTEKGSKRKVSHTGTIT